MALLDHAGLDGLLMVCESARLSQEQLDGGVAAGLLGAAVVRAPRTARVVKRRAEPDEEPARARPAAKRPKPAGPPAPANPGKAIVPARVRAPRSPDEKRKLSRQMAAFMRYGVLVLPSDVKVRAARRGAPHAPYPPRPSPHCARSADAAPRAALAEQEGEARR